ncbi:carboxypeptidase-like regulatory domain-containing protein [Salinimicrobium sp. TH3]|uniref:carboxypeptidase-like regulatory domain-containing protein n=1 Tax=Salinimicrobium sp. TH3 TaxID=2997342 RepID=UPI002273847E|nr:carboxypeptidase-like regulatory domain-containing protein [Salinimicrobium sp. TH3]MCY2687657.1 carboxypeptidase-like regulatory domain-containing protein [Salinimicrobium sp. TH3]
MKQIFFLLIFWSLSSLHAQHQISGKVTDKNGQPIVGANVYLEESYDGATTNSIGEFTFHTSLEGEQTLIIFIAMSAISDILTYSNMRLEVKLNGYTGEQIIVSRERVKDFKEWLG